MPTSARGDLAGELIHTPWMANMTGQQRYLHIMRRRDSELILTAAQLIRMVQHEDQEFSAELQELAKRLDTLGDRLRPIDLDRSQAGDRDGL